MKLAQHTLVVAACLVAAGALTAPAVAGGTVHAARATHHKRHRHHHPPRPRPPAPTQCAGADSSASSAALAQMRSAVVCLVNQQRTKRGLPALAVASELNDSAQAWTHTMVLTGQFTHGPGDAFARRISAAGYSWQTAGENIATGFPTPRSVVAAWMASTDHCRNILDPAFRDIGTGESDAAVGAFASGPATWTQDFGLRLGQPVPSHNAGPMNGCPY